MSKRLAAMTIPEMGQTGALLPPPPTAAKLALRSLSGLLHEGSSPAEGRAPDDGKPAKEAAEQQGSNARNPADMCSAAASITQEQHSRHAVPAPVTHEGRTHDMGEEEDDQYGNFVVA